MEEILRIIRENENFILAGHIGPDGDAIGSCFALALALKEIGKNAQVVLEPFSRKYSAIPGKEFLFGGKPDELSPQVFFALDCADIERLGAAKPLFERAAVTVCIDHHETNTGFARYNLIEPDASSASEMVLRVVENFTAVTPDIAAAVYAGMVSDTGGFRYNATAKSTMEIAARLMEQIPFTDIYNELMHRHSFSGGKALGLALEAAGRSPDKKIVYTHMTKKMLHSVGASLADLDGVVEYLMGTRGALAAIFVYQKSVTKSEVKISLRSQGPNMGRVAAALGGGGHALAAGATAQGDTAEVLSRTLQLVTAEVAAYEGNTDGNVNSDSTCTPTANNGGAVAGVINVRKEKGYTSHDVVAIVRKITGAKVGHTGTLDPDAEGVLPLCLGRATKFAEHFSAADKSYIAEIVCGITTDTYDTSGKILTQTDAKITLSDIISAAKSFEGEILQTPPMFSAIKIGGKKLYELARKGETVERPPRTVKIFNLEVIEESSDVRPKFFLHVTCSKGTYIRSLCHDIGQKLGCGAAMGELTRTRSGIFALDTAHTLDEIRAAAADNKLEEIILPLEKLLPYPTVFIKHDALSRAKNGNRLPPELLHNEITAEKVWLKTLGGENIGLFAKKGNVLRSEVLL